MIAKVRHAILLGGVNGYLTFLSDLVRACTQFFSWLLSMVILKISIPSSNNILLFDLIISTNVPVKTNV